MIAGTQHATRPSINIFAVERGFRLQTEVRLPQTPEEIFPFFADAHNLELLTPDYLHFKILTPGQIEMCEGALIDYKLRLHGIPIRWRTEIAAWEPPYRFIDQQLRGPYKWWVHEHRFVRDGDETIAQDIVDYNMLGGRLANRLLVARDLRGIFEYRAAKLIEIFGSCE